MKSSYEEFKGTGNMELHLTAHRHTSASTRPSTSPARAPAREELEFLIDKLAATKTNDEFFDSMKRQQK